MSLDDRLREEFRRVAASGPTDLAPGTRDLVVRRAAAVRRQRRVVLAVAASAVIVGAGLTAVLAANRSGGQLQPGGPSHSSTRPTLSEIPPPTSSYSSPLYGYTVSYPKGWVVTPATTVWINGKNSQGDPGVSDIFQSPGKPRVEIAVQQVPAGWSAARWESDFLPNPVPTQMAACYPRPTDWAGVTIAGHRGGLLGRVGWCGFTEGVVVIGQRGYAIKGVVDPTTLTGDSFDMGVLNAMFATLKVPRTPASH
jgi:hypothetical protein